MRRWGVNQPGSSIIKKSVLPNSKQLHRMIALAMQEKAPAMYARLKAGGQLDREISDRAQVAKDSYREAIAQEPKAAVLSRQNLDPLHQVGDRAGQMRAAAEVALDQATEFHDEGD